jgi:hypothetical protein
MFVRMKTGRFAGEVREFPFATARDLIANDRATRYEFGSEVLRDMPAVAAPAVVNEPKAKKPKAGKKNGRI